MKEILDEISPLWGVCRFEDISDRLIECRAKSRIPDNAESIIMMTFPYLLPDEYYSNSNISKYAVPADYHPIVMTRLESAAEKLRAKYPEEKFACFADNSPIPEVRAAVMSGIGVRGKNSLLITKEYGSFVFLGEIITTLKLEPTPEAVTTCIGCNRCVEACPGKTILESGIIKEKCLSDITQRKGELDETQIKMITDSCSAWGCDICQDVCPMNKGVSVTQIEEFISSAEGIVDENTSIEGRAFAWRGKAVIERNLKLRKEKS